MTRRLTQKTPYSRITTFELQINRQELLRSLDELRLSFQMSLSKKDGMKYGCLRLFSGKNLKTQYEAIATSGCLGHQGEYDLFNTSKGPLPPSSSFTPRLYFVDTQVIQSGTDNEFAAHFPIEVVCFNCDPTKAQSPKLQHLPNIANDCCNLVVAESSGWYYIVSLLKTCRKNNIKQLPLTVEYSDP